MKERVCCLYRVSTDKLTNYIRFWHEVYELAVKEAKANDLIRKNPVRFAEKMRYREPVKRKDVFTAEEVTILMEPHWPQHPSDAVVGLPKSRDSYRTIPVPQSLRWCAVALRQTGKRFIWEAGKEDTPCNPSHFRDRSRKALEAIPEVRTLTPHSCRHTCVSQAQALGVDLSTIQSIVVHADVDMTQHHLHVQESIRQDAVDRFSKAFPSSHGRPDDPGGNACNVIKFPNVG